MTTLAILQPIDPGTGSRVTVRVCSSQAREATGASGERWIPAMVVQPVLTMALFDGDFTSAVSPAQSRIVLRLEALKEAGGFDRAARFDWSGAPVTLYRLEAGAPALLAEMRVRTFGSEAGALALDLSVDSEWADAEVLFRRYAGTSGAEGIADLKDRLKPWAFGRCRNVEPVQIDLIDNVFQVSGYGPVSAISAVYERGASFGASLGDHANYAALVAADIPEGRWGTCLAEGMFRLGAPPAGVITCDVDGDSTSGFLRRTGAIISEIARRLGLETRVNAASLAALDVDVPRNVNIFLTEQTTLIDLAQAMAAPCNAVAALALDSRLVMPRIAFGSAQIVLDAQGRQMPPVLGMARQNSSPPYSEIKMGAARSWRVHTFDEIAFFADLIDRGLYDAATTYREGNIVELIDKSRWVYVNPAASSGNAPPTWPTASNSFWSNIAPPVGGDLIGSIVAPANANRVPFSRMEGDRGWIAATNSPDGPTPGYFEFEGRRAISANATATAAGQVITLAAGPGNQGVFPVVPGERLSVSARIGDATNTSGLQINFGYTRANGTYNEIAVVAVGAQGWLASPVAGFVDVPSDARLGTIRLYAFAAAAGFYNATISEPMVTSAAPGQTVHPPYTPGPNSVDGATRNTGALNADGLDSIDAGGPLFVGLLPPSKAEAGLINANVALGSNAVVNSDFTRGKFGWRWGGGGFEDQWGTNLPGWFGQRNVMWARVSGAFASGSSRDLSPDALWAGGTLANAPLFALAVNDADRLFAGVLAASHRCAFQLWILVFDGAGTLIQAEEAIGGLPDGAANGDPANFSRITRFSDVPTGGRWAIPMMRMLGNGGNDPFIFFTEPMLAKVPSGQTGIPRYTPGRADSRGQPNSDILISGGVISGIGTANIFVDNARAVLQSLASARPAAGEYLNQVHFATDTLVASQWDGFNWRSSADITFAVSGPGEVVLDYDSTGAIVTPLPTSTSYLLTPAGGVALTSGVSWSVAVVSGTFSGAAPSISGAGTGVLQINSGLTSNEAVLRITGTVAGRSYPPMTVRVTKRTAAPAGGGGGFASTTSFNAVSTSSFAALTGVLNVVLPSGSTSVALTAVSLGVSLAAALPLGSTTLEIRWQRESSPGVWSDVGAAATSSPSPFVQTEGGGIYSVDPGSITCNRTATGLTGGSTQRFRLVGRVSAGNVRSVFTTGTASAQA